MKVFFNILTQTGRISTETNSIFMLANCINTTQSLPLLYLLLT